MSTTRVVFIIVCVVAAVIVFTLGIIIQKNNPDSKYSVAKALSPRPAGERRRRLRLPKNPNIYMTFFLIILLLFLYFVYSRR